MHRALQYSILWLQGYSYAGATMTNYPDPYIRPFFFVLGVPCLRALDAGLWVLCFDDVLCPGFRIWSLLGFRIQGGLIRVYLDPK